MKYISVTILSLLFYTSIALPKLVTINGCQGEACDCFREDQKTPKPAVFNTIRDFTVYKEPNQNSVKLAEHKAGTKARLIEQFILVEDAGEYIVERVTKGKKIALKKNDKLNTLLNEGEGYSSIRKKNKTISFYFEDVNLKIIRDTKVSEWIKVKVTGVEGYTSDYPFEGCLE